MFLPVRQHKLGSFRLIKHHGKSVSRNPCRKDRFVLRKYGQQRYLRCVHFKSEGVPKSSFYRIIQRFMATGSGKPKSPPGRPPVIISPETIERVSRLFARNPCISEREAARRLNLTVSTLGYIKRVKLQLRSRKKIRAPMYVNGQAERAIANCKFLARKLYEKSGRVLIMDDETYVPVDPTQIPGQGYYSCGQNLDPPIACKVAPKTKFPGKYLIWPAIDEYGNITPAFVSKGSMDGATYLKECLKKRLLPFLKKYHPKKRIFLWIDMANVHYKNEVLQWLRANRIDFPEWHRNTPNVPQVRPIERFWALCKAQYKKCRTPADSLRTFTVRWRGISKKVASASGANLMRSIRTKIKRLGQNGVYDYLKDSLA